MSPTATVFSVHTILPSQFFPRVHADRMQPERRLAAAVLEDAVNEYRRYAAATTRRGRRRFAEVEQWFLSDDGSWPFSFRSLCNALELHADWFRTRLYRSRPGLPGIEPWKAKLPRR
jgi:hypothetical protein